MSKKFRGCELYIYLPDTFLMPILVLSRTNTQFAIRFGNSLSHFTLINEGLNRKCGPWIIIQEGKNYLFDEWKEELQSEEDDGWEFYLKVYDEYVPPELKKRFEDE